MEVTLTLISLESLSTIKMKFGQILVCCTANISNTLVLGPIMKLLK